MSALPAILILSSRGEETARRLASTLGGDVLSPAPGELKTLLTSLWERPRTALSGIIGVGAAAIYLRAAASLLRDKASDPPLVCVSEDGGMVVPLTGGHLGGGFDLARACAKALDATLAATCSSDRAGLTAPDLLCRRWGFVLEGKEHLPAVNGALLDEGILPLRADPEFLRLPFPPCYRVEPAEEKDGETTPGEDAPHPKVLVSFRNAPLPPGAVRLVPPCIVAGVGCRKGVAAEDVVEALRASFREGGYTLSALAECRTIPEKEFEPGLVEAANLLGVPLRICSREELLALPGPFTPSAAERHLDLPGVAEPCAATAGPLLAPRTSSRGVTVALSLRPLRFQGRVDVVGTGPGDARFLTAEARAAIEGAEVLVGYALYIDQIPEAWRRNKWVKRFSMGEEEERVRLALNLAERGYAVALLSGGDPVLFGMAGLTHSLAAETSVPVRVIPGISAIQAAGALLGAPYTNGLTCISLSDYLQPWEEVLQALRGAAMGGLTVALYNPVRRDLETKLAAVREIFASLEGPVLLVRDVGRPEESFRAIPLEALSPAEVDMRTLVVLPGRNVLWNGTRLLDRRGYRSERGRNESTERVREDEAVVRSRQKSPSEEGAAP